MSKTFIINHKFKAISKTTTYKGEMRYLKRVRVNLLIGNTRTYLRILGGYSSSPTEKSASFNSYESIDVDIPLDFDVNKLEEGSYKTSKTAITLKLKDSQGREKSVTKKVRDFRPHYTGAIFQEYEIDDDYPYYGDEDITITVVNGSYRTIGIPPIISGENKDLGNISDEINYKYTVFDKDGDTLSIVERLNNEVIEVRNNVKSGSEFTATIPKEKIYDLKLGKKNTLQIEVSDGQERTYRNITFTRINTAPIIKIISEKELGEMINPFESKVSISDPEEDKVNLIYTINRIVLDENESYTRIPVHTTEMEDIELDSEINYTIGKEVWDKLLIGDYELEIKAIDDQSGENKEVITFTRTEDEIEFITPTIVKDVQPKQFISLWLINGNPTNIKIEACNNGLDDKPTWEDVTTEATEAIPYSFKNSTKTADKWAIMAKISLDGKGGSK